ncbi:hypothetical protein Mp_8g17580 [Marchantia polymorpha subsp. ruderalis]|uniref:Uncharacterized protein n=1 Tax=Marchantia polymorpha TaxID=3197 RepID=A0A2R6X8C5_MARPO|nr:hypothetical protein MARPO_0030s0092 [Marchantia polymorpha]BBN20238.1 hypothetical protein Mp_8g17580 [Marchantia polymorpha subsp. ruderalis]|eukprot:PTQ42356.1 hypothetical protein MARPO_0030s0092 [Marchantia polymorpha]
MRIRKNHKREIIREDETVHCTDRFDSCASLCVMSSRLPMRTEKRAIGPKSTSDANGLTRETTGTRPSCQETT